ncbi:type IV pilin biogenesis protein [Photorhabdus australis subsp. thailandensis]|uniref:Type IV pilin biogenesis protein n=1 Tax=Photorhabdus australis subsp. thailandensis TaxID=2805096 RepID=A0A1C0U3T7_9GAMM|nr:type II secretion system F family protein [Photorhabdus australis]OCQ52561.1 type IV pilin biogenesis protein [Photorhabdus australis subsp. thailandensis]
MFKQQREHTSSVDVQVSAVVRWIYRKTFSAKDRIAFYDMLAFLLDNNKSLRQALVDMRNVATDFGKKKHPIAVLLTDCIQALDEGQDALETMLMDWIPVQEATLIGSGVLAGNIADALRRASRIVQGKSEMTSALTGAVVYPAFLLFLVVLMMNLVCNKFIPQLAKLVPREKWQGPLKQLTDISEFFVHHGMVIISILLLLSGLIYWSLGHWQHRKIADLLPPWSVYRSVQGVYFLLNIAALLRVNIQVLNAVKMLGETASPWLETRINETVRYMSQGQHLGLALKSTGYHFPSKDCVNQMMLLTEGSGAENILEHYANRWLEQTIKQVKKKAAYLMALCFLLVFSYMLLLLLATKDLNNLVNQMG